MSLFKPNLDLIFKFTESEQLLTNHRKHFNHLFQYLILGFFAYLQVLTSMDYLDAKIGFKLFFTILLITIASKLIKIEVIIPEFWTALFFHSLVIYMFILEQYLSTNLFILIIPFLNENMTTSSTFKLVNIILGVVYCFASIIASIFIIQLQSPDIFKPWIFNISTLFLYFAILYGLTTRYKEIKHNSAPVITLNIPDAVSETESSEEGSRIALSESDNPDAIHERDKNHFYSNFSNEIRNSLNAINISLDYLLKAVNDKAHLDILSNARTAGKMAINYVNNMLDASKTKPDEIELCYLRAKPSELLKQVLAITQDNIFKRGITLKAFIDKSMPSRFSMDSNRITQILINVITNAIKFTDAGGHITIYNGYTETDKDLLHPFDNQDAQMYNPESPISSSWDTPPSFLPRRQSGNTITSESELQASEKATPHAKKVGVTKMRTMHELSEMHAILKKKFKLIDLSTLNTASTSSLQKPQTYIASKGYLKYQVSDSGCGMSKHLLQSLFNENKSQQLDTKDDKSSGISLAVCQMLVKRMGGKLDILSKPGKGTTVMFYVPVELGESPRVESGTSLIKKDKLRAIVVDDLAYNREIHKLILQRENVLVDIASNGKECIDLLYSNSDDYYDFILTDIDMPDMDGITAAKEIRRNELTSGRRPIDIYFVSGNQEEITYKTISSIHSNSAITKFIPKPIDISTVKKLIACYSKLLKKPIQINSKYLVPSIEEISTPERKLPRKRSSEKVMKKLNGLLT